MTRSPTAAAPAAPSAWQIEKAMSIAMQALEALEVTQGPGSVDENEAIAFIANQGADIPSLMQRLLLAASEAKANSDAVATRIADLRTREARFDRHQEAYRAAALSVMTALPELFPGGQFKCPELSARVAHGKPAVIVTDIDKLEDRFVRIKREPDKTAIATAFADGEIIEGAEQSNARDFLVIRTS